MSDPHPSKKPKIHPGDPIDPRPGYGRVKMHFLIAGILAWILAYVGAIHWLGGLLFGILLIVWAVDNEYFDYGG